MIRPLFYFLLNILKDKIERIIYSGKTKVRKRQKFFGKSRMPL